MSPQKIAWANHQRMERLLAEIDAPRLICKSAARAAAQITREKIERVMGR